MKKQETYIVVATKAEIERVLNSELKGLVISYEFEESEDPFDEGKIDTSTMVVTDYSKVVEFLGRI